MMKILVVCTTDSMIWNFLVPHIKYWQQEHNLVEIACSRTGFYFKELQKQGFTLYEMPFKRSPFNYDNFKAFLKLKGLVQRNNYDLIVSQEPVGGVVGRLVGRACGVKNIYTAHGFHFFRGAPFKNWLLFYPVEKILSFYTDTLITINQEDYEISKQFYAKRIVRLNGIGVDLNKFHATTDVTRIEARRALGIGKEQFVVLTVAELIPRKNYITSLDAIRQCKIKNVVYLICGNGILKEELVEVASKFGISEQTKFLGFRKDVNLIYHAADVFLFPSFQEGLSIALIEAMACGLPIVCSNIRGNRDLVINQKGGLLYNPRDVKGFVQGLKYCYTENTFPFSEFNQKRIKAYGIDISVKKFYEIIQNCME